MTKALRQPHPGFLARLSLLLMKCMVILPIFIVILNLLTWQSHWDIKQTLRCWMYLSDHDNYVLYGTCALNILVHLVFLLKFLVQTHQAAKMANLLVSDLKEITVANSADSLCQIEHDATRCKNKARSASRRNLLIAVNATVWAVMAYAVIPFVGGWTINVYMVRMSLLLGALTNNLFLYFIFSEWGVYICFVCHRDKLNRTLRGISRMPLVLDDCLAENKHFLKRVGDDQKVEYFASPLIIYKSANANTML